MTYILDTNVISELVRKRPNQNVVDWVDRLDESQAFLSVITIGELSKGIERVREKRRKAKLANWLHTDLLPRFGDRILNIDPPVMFVWGELIAQLEKGGVPMPAIDSMIAATAIHTGFSIVTRNISDFENAPVEIIDPWAD